MPSAPDEYPDTVTEALDLLARDGYTDTFGVGDGAVSCGGCGVSHHGDEVLVDRFYRFEGMSDPDDEAIVFGLRCPGCQTKGTLVSAFGPGADPEVMDTLVLLHRNAR